MPSSPVPVLPVGTIVQRQQRGTGRIHPPARILDSFTKWDRLGRRQIWYRVQTLEDGLIREWPGSHCQMQAAAPALT